MAKKINFEERIKIETGIIREESFKNIGKDLGRSTGSISREVLKNRVFEPGSYHFNNNCLYAKGCLKNHLCGDMNCPFLCKTCRKRGIIGECSNRCPEYVPMNCTLLVHPPYVCNSCPNKAECNTDKYFYKAKEAENNSQRTRSESRRGPHLDDGAMGKLDKLITPLIKNNGQSLAHICATKANKIPVSERTLYRYIDGNWFTVRNIDLSRKVSYHPRNKVEPDIENEPIKDKAYKKSRTYAIFTDYINMFSDRKVVEMDTVVGAKGSRKRLLTFFFKEYDFLVIHLIPNGKAESVVAVFDKLQDKLSIDTFRALFPIILTDNGGEFQHVNSLEMDKNKQYRCNIYYCDSMSSWQKGSIEKSHELIREILPKKTSFEWLTQEDCITMMCHINSYKRDKLKDKSPFEIINTYDDRFHKLLDVLGVFPIPPNEVCLKPSLLSRRRK